MNKELSLFEYILVIHGFVDVFRTSLPSLPLDRDIDFPIEFELDVLDLFP